MLKENPFDSILGEEILVIYSNSNVKGKKDATGAFIPEAKAFAKFYCVPEENMLGIPCTRVKASVRRNSIKEFLSIHNGGGIRLVAWFGHGWSQGIQFGFNKRNVGKLTRWMVGCCAPDVSQVLYACSTASTSKSTRKISMPGTDGGFADTLRDAMWEYGFTGGWVDAHLQPGHTTKNPYILRFICDEDHVIRGGGIWLVKPKTTYWATWVNAVRNTNFRYIFPTLSKFNLNELPVA